MEFVIDLATEMGLEWSRILFLGLVVLLVAQRLLEMRHSQRNEARMRAKGGREHAPKHFALMKFVHTAWFVAMIVEVFWFDRRLESGFDWAVAGGALCMTVLGQLLRYSAIRTLGERWSVRIYTVPDAPAVNGGIYRFVRHPNYLGVILEIAAVPMLHHAYLTAIVFSVANAIVLYIRIGAEEQALREENEYHSRLGQQPRFLPGSGSSRD